MKKVLSIMAIVLMLALPAWAQDWTQGSGQKTTDALIFTGEGVFHGIIVSSDSTNAITVDVYDGITATGTKLLPTTVVTTSAIDRIQAIKPPGGPVKFYTGLYVDITCSGTAKYVVYYRW
jgi:hypothetical protein